MTGRACRVAVLLIAFALGARQAFTQQFSGDFRLDDSVRKVASELRCPVCQGESIQESPSELSKEMRAVVREQLASGKSTDEVKAYFVSKYGEWILLEPKAQGVTLTVYVVPVLLLVGGAIGLAVAVRKWSGKTQAPEQHAPSLTSEPGAPMSR